MFASGDPVIDVVDPVRYEESDSSWHGLISMRGRALSVHPIVAWSIRTLGFDSVMNGVGGTPSVMNVMGGTLRTLLW
jgi:hypothetical protein